MTTPTAARPVTARKAPTQPLGWDWVTDWAALDGRLRELERRHCPRRVRDDADRA